MRTTFVHNRRFNTVVALVALLSIMGFAGHASAAVVISYTTSPTQGTNLTTEGSADWVQLSSGGRNEKIGASFIGDVIRVNAVAATWNPDYNLNWSDGTPTLNGTNVDGSWEAKRTGTGNPSFDYDITGPAGTYTMIVYGTLYSGTGVFTASVSGGGPSDSVTLGSAGAGNRVSYTVDFDLASGQHLDVTYELTVHDNANDNVGIAGITLSYIPEPSTAVLLSLGTITLIRRRRKRRHFE